MTISPAITIEGLRKTYSTPNGPKHAVNGVDLEIRTGEVFALLGPNGAGKTTLVEILEGYRKRNAGKVSVLGLDPAHPTRSWRTRVGIVAQTTFEQDELKVAEMVKHFATFYPHPRDPEEVITAVGLEEKRNARVHTLSGGQRRRLDVALGIVGRPELLFLDEPTTGFDPQARRSFWDLVRDLRTSGTTIMLTTHYLDEAEALADRVGVIANGTLVALDTADKLGGRGQAQALVKWDDQGSPRQEHTDTPTALIATLAEQFGGEIPGLRVSRPTLEDTYLSLIGQASLNASPTSPSTD